MGDGNTFTDGPIEITWDDTVDDAKEVLQQAKTTKTELQAEKREINAQLAEMRAEYRQRVAHRIPVRGGRGFLGGMIRGSRAADRAGTNDKVRPLEQRKAVVEAGLISLDRAIAHLKAWIAERGGGPAERPRAQSAPDDPFTMLDRLASLKERGAITAEEYEAKKAELLARM